MRIKLKPKRDNDFRQMWFVGSYQVLGRRSRDFTFINTARTRWLMRRSSDNLTQLCVVFINYMSHLLLYYMYYILNMIQLCEGPKDSHRCAECDTIEMFVLWNVITHTHTDTHTHRYTLAVQVNLCVEGVTWWRQSGNVQRWSRTRRDLQPHTHTHTLVTSKWRCWIWRNVSPGLFFFFFFSLTWPPLLSSFSILLFLFFFDPSSILFAPFFPPIHH